MDGVLPLRKPAGMTSHDAVAKVRKILGIRRIGHTGTLDPDVTGVLPLCIGKATRAVEWLQELPKEYEAVMRIGMATDTGDLGGQVTERIERARVTEEEVERTLERFRGIITQVPPMYSAVRVGGKRLYELAREGLEVERKARQVTIHELEALRMNLELPHPEVGLRVLCSKGTYIRTLCEDIGRALGYPAVMSGLVRTSSGGIRLEECLELDEIESLHKAGKLADRLIPVDRALGHFPSCVVSGKHLRKALSGAALSLEDTVNLPEERRHGNETRFRIYLENGMFVGVYSLDKTRRLLKPVKVFA